MRAAAGAQGCWGRLLARLQAAVLAWPAPAAQWGSPSAAEQPPRPACTAAQPRAHHAHHHPPPTPAPAAPAPRRLYSWKSAADAPIRDAFKRQKDFVMREFEDRSGQVFLQVRRAAARWPACGAAGGPVVLLAGAGAVAAGVAGVAGAASAAGSAAASQAAAPCCRARLLQHLQCPAAQACCPRAAHRAPAHRPTTHGPSSPTAPPPHPPSHPLHPLHRAQLNEQGLNVALYWKNPDPRSFVNVVPTSAITGEGIPDLLQLIVKLTQSMMGARLQYSPYPECRCGGRAGLGGSGAGALCRRCGGPAARGPLPGPQLPIAPAPAPSPSPPPPPPHRPPPPTHPPTPPSVLEVKTMEGLGTSVDVVLVNGTIKEGDRIVVCGLQVRAAARSAAGRGRSWARAACRGAWAWRVRAQQARAQRAQQQLERTCLWPHCTPRLTTRSCSAAAPPAPAPLSHPRTSHPHPPTHPSRHHRAPSCRASRRSRRRRCSRRCGSRGS